MTIDQQVDDGEMLLAYAIANKLAVPAGVDAVLWAARGNIATIQAPGHADRIAFLQALVAMTAAVPASAADLRSSSIRRLRVTPRINDALSLMEYAAANAKKVDDDNRKELLESSDAVNKGAPSLDQEQKFFKAYEALTTATAPVTAETLAASRTKLPTIRAFFSQEHFWESWEGLTLGRFVDAILFVLLLLMTCLALQYHTVGSEGLRRLQELDSKLLIATADAGKNADLVKLRQTAFEDKAAATVELRQAARQSLMDAQRDFDAGRALVTKLAEERSALPDRLWKWSQQPCEVALLRTALCSRIDGVSKGDELKSDIARTAAAITIVRWMNEILLPLLLGWLGAYAFVIRQMTSEISARSFAKASSLRHITRLALGALAGIASSWLLTNDVFSGQLKNVPAWVLAFVAGYGIELVFAFLDRIITAFTKKES